MSPQEQVEGCGREAAALLGRLLGDDLVAVWLGGSGALGGVTAGQSDVDLVAVCAASPGEPRRRAIVDGLSELAMTWPVRGLEFVLYTRAAVAAPGRAAELRAQPRRRPGDALPPVAGPGGRAGPLVPA